MSAKDYWWLLRPWCIAKTGSRQVNDILAASLPLEETGPGGYDFSDFTGLDAAGYKLLPHQRYAFDKNALNDTWWEDTKADIIQGVYGGGSAWGLKLYYSPYYFGVYRKELEGKTANYEKQSGATSWQDYPVSSSAEVVTYSGPQDIESPFWTPTTRIERGGIITTYGLISTALTEISPAPSGVSPPTKTVSIVGHAAMPLHPALRNALRGDVSWTEGWTSGYVGVAPAGTVTLYGGQIPDIMEFPATAIWNTDVASHPDPAIVKLAMTISTGPYYSPVDSAIGRCVIAARNNNNFSLGDATLADLRQLIVEKRYKPITVKFLGSVVEDIEVDNDWIYLTVPRDVVGTTNAPLVITIEYEQDMLELKGTGKGLFAVYQRVSQTDYPVAPETDVHIWSVTYGYTGRTTGPRPYGDSSGFGKESYEYIIKNGVWDAVVSNGMCLPLNTTFPPFGNLAPIQPDVFVGGTLRAYFKEAIRQSGYHGSVLAYNWWDAACMQFKFGGALPCVVTSGGAMRLFDKIEAVKSRSYDAASFLTVSPIYRDGSAAKIESTLAIRNGNVQEASFAACPWVVTLTNDRGVPSDYIQRDGLLYKGDKHIVYSTKTVYIVIDDNYGDHDRMSRNYRSFFGGEDYSSNDPPNIDGYALPNPGTDPSYLSDNSGKIAETPEMLLGLGISKTAFYGGHNAAYEASGGIQATVRFEAAYDDPYLAPTNSGSESAEASLSLPYAAGFDLAGAPILGTISLSATTIWSSVGVDGTITASHNASAIGKNVSGSFTFTGWSYGLTDTSDSAVHYGETLTLGQSINASVTSNISVGGSPSAGPGYDYGSSAGGYDYGNCAVICQSYHWQGVAYPEQTLASSISHETPGGVITVTKIRGGKSPALYEAMQNGSTNLYSDRIVKGDAIQRYDWLTSDVMLALVTDGLAPLRWDSWEQGSQNGAVPKYFSNFAVIVGKTYSMCHVGGELQAYGNANENVGTIEDGLLGNLEYTAKDVGIDKITIIDQANGLPVEVAVLAFDPAQMFMLRCGPNWATPNVIIKPLDANCLVVNWKKHQTYNAPVPNMFGILPTSQTVGVPDSPLEATGWSAAIYNNKLTWTPSDYSDPTKLLRHSTWKTSLGVVLTTLYASSRHIVIDFIDSTMPHQAIRPVIGSYQHGEFDVASQFFVRDEEQKIFYLDLTKTTHDLSVGAQFANDMWIEMRDSRLPFISVRVPLGLVILKPANAVSTELPPPNHPGNASPSSSPPGSGPTI